jgi:hypothetical protein
MSGTLEQRSAASIFYLYSSKPDAYFNNTIAVSTTTSAFSLGPAGEYEIVVWHDSGGSSTSNIRIASIFDSTGAKTIMALGIDAIGYTVRRFKTSEESLSIRLRNNDATAVIGVIITLVS